MGEWGQDKETLRSLINSQKQEKPFQFNVSIETTE